MGWYQPATSSFIHANGSITGRKDVRPHDPASEYVVEVVDRTMLEASTEKFGELPFTSLSFDRRRNDISTCTLTVPWFSKPIIDGGLEPWRHSILVRRNGYIVWMGPIVSVFANGQVVALDVMAHYMKKLLQADVNWDPQLVWGVGGPDPWWTPETPTYSEPIFLAAKVLIDAWAYDNAGLRFPLVTENAVVNSAQISCWPQTTFSLAASSLVTAFDAFQRMSPLGWSMANDRAYFQTDTAFYDGALFMYTLFGSPELFPTFSIGDFNTAEDDFGLDGEDTANEVYFAGGGSGHDGSPFLEVYSWAAAPDPDPSTVAGGGYGRLQARGHASSAYGTYGMSDQPAFQEYLRRKYPLWVIRGLQLKPGSPMSLIDLVPGRVANWEIPYSPLLPDPGGPILARISNVRVEVGVSQGSSPVETITFDVEADPT